jgi:hypothetical protein
MPDPPEACEADQRSDRRKNRIDINRYHKYHIVETIMMTQLKYLVFLKNWWLHIVDRWECLSRL